MARVGLWRTSIKRLLVTSFGDQLAAGNEFAAQPAVDMVIDIVAIEHLNQHRQLAQWRFLPFLVIRSNVDSQEATMQSMNISLPQPLKNFVDEQVATGRYSNASEYVRELIRADGKRKAEGQLEALLLEGLNGEETTLAPSDWRDIRAKALHAVEARKKQR